MDKYRKYLDVLRGVFENTYENAGGKEFRYFHCLNVAKISKLISQKIDLSEEEEDVVIIASIFHDVSKSKRIQASGLLDGSKNYETSNKLISHELESADMVMGIIGDNVAKEKSQKIQKTIANHNSPTTVTEKILHDADELSEMGTMNLWKMFTYSSYIRRNINETMEYWEKTDKKRHQQKIDSLCLKESKEEGRKRLKIIDNIIDDLKRQYAD